MVDIDGKTTHHHHRAWGCGMYQRPCLSASQLLIPSWNLIARSPTFQNLAWDVCSAGRFRLTKDKPRWQASWRRLYRVVPFVRSTSRHAFPVYPNVFRSTWFNYARRSTLCSLVRQPNNTSWILWTLHVLEEGHALDETQRKFWNKRLARMRTDLNHPWLCLFSLGEDATIAVQTRTCKSRIQRSCVCFRFRHTETAQPLVATIPPPPPPQSKHMPAAEPVGKMFGQASGVFFSFFFSFLLWQEASGGGAYRHLKPLTSDTHTRGPRKPTHFSEIDRCLPWSTFWGKTCEEHCCSFLPSLAWNLMMSKENPALEKSKENNDPALEMWWPTFSFHSIFQQRVKGELHTTYWQKHAHRTIGISLLVVLCWRKHQAKHDRNMCKKKIGQSSSQSITDQ